MKDNILLPLVLKGENYKHMDSLEAQPHDPDVKALLRIAVVYDIPIANNLATADFMLHSKYMNESYSRQIENFDKKVQNRVEEMK